MIVDFHAHALDEQFIHDLTKTPVAGLRAERGDEGYWVIRRQGDDRKSSIDPNLHNLPKRLESLHTTRAWGSTVCAPAVHAGVAGRRLRRRACPRVERGEVIAFPPSLAAGWRCWPYLRSGNPKLAAQELQRAVDEYGVRGVMMPSSAGGKPLDGPELAPLFTLIERLGLVIFMHPTSAVTSERFGMYGVHVLVGWPFETTLAVTRMIFEGLFERHPKLKLVRADGGGQSDVLARPSRFSF